MKRPFLFSVFALIPFFISFSCIASDIDVQIAPHSLVNQTSSSVVTVTVTNTGTNAVYVPKSLSPFYAPSNHLMTKIFKVTDASGKEVPFTGRMVRVAPRDPDTYFFKIDAGKSMSQDIDLSTDYDLTTAGTFQVSYTQGYTLTIHMDADGEIDSDYNYQASQSVSIWIAPPKTGASSHSMALSQPTQTSDGQQCTSAQTTTIRAAALEAYNVSLNALQGIETLYTVVQSEDSSGTPIYQGRIKDDATYTTWFGPTQNTGGVYYSKPSYTDYWRTNVDFEMIHFMNSIALRIGAGNYLCGCPGYDSRTAAWTIPQTRTITFCEGFFNLKQSDGFYDSQVLTLIHEVSHYVDTWGEGTGDYAYGHQGARSLAAKDKFNAVKNADNIMYYEGTYIH